MSPTLIITCGPTASGKSKLPMKVKKYLKLKGGFQSFLIDDLVEKNPHFIEKIKEFIQTQKNKSKTKKQIVDMFLNPSEKTIKTFNYYYTSARKTTNCKTGADLHYDWGNSCDILNELSLTCGFNSGKNIVFESRGVSWPQWFFDLFQCQLKQHNYTIIVAWTVVDMCELLERNVVRAKKNVEQFLKSASNPPPRLPDIRIDAYTHDLKQIIQTFQEQNKKQSNCKQNCIQLLVFDNNGKRSKLLYDNKIHSVEIGNKAIEQYNVTENNTCNKSKKNAKSSLRNKTRKTKR